MDEPLREVMYWPECGRQHVDGRWWAHRPHQNHVCSFCDHRGITGMRPSAFAQSLLPFPRRKVSDGDGRPNRQYQSEE